MLLQQAKNKASVYIFPRSRSLMSTRRNKAAQMWKLCRKIFWNFLVHVKVEIPSEMPPADRFNLLSGLRWLSALNETENREFSACAGTLIMESKRHLVTNMQKQTFIRYLLFPTLPAWTRRVRLKPRPSCAIHMRRPSMFAMENLNSPTMKLITREGIAYYSSLCFLGIEARDDAMSWNTPAGTYMSSYREVVRS